MKAFIKTWFWYFYFQEFCKFITQKKAKPLTGSESVDSKSDSMLLITIMFGAFGAVLLRREKCHRRVNLISNILSFMIIIKIMCQIFESTSFDTLPYRFSRMHELIIGNFQKGFSEAIRYIGSQKLSEIGPYFQPYCRLPLKLSNQRLN